MTTPKRPGRRWHVELVPIKQFSRRYGRGWRMVPGYPLEPGDYAVVMCPPNWKGTTLSNVSRGATSRNLAASAKRRAYAGAE